MPNTTPLTAHVLDLIRSMTTLTEEEKERYIAALEANALTPAMREALASAMEREATAIGEHIAELETLRDEARQTLDREQAAIAPQEQQVLADLQQHLDASVASFQQKTLATERSLDADLEQMLAAAPDAAEAEQIRQSLKQTKKD
ncbi:MAG: hypothetical protein G01um101425_734 [Candidatus Peregrinibacteria bacterium Gr01-1014_25]|nr:MAG: hypothetical protein G01um101425_734 [Candidatus Peregrinibacteria bacterium Gr01-1014_25]